jgi:hypothetical protein
MKKYKDNDGNYLGIDEQNGAFYLAWFGYGEYGSEDVAAYVGDLDERDVHGSSEEDRKSRWEIVTADKAVKSFSCGKGEYGYEFESKKQARLALVAANAALLGGAPMPDWAIKATEAGWKPPAGWKP